MGAVAATAGAVGLPRFSIAQTLQSAPRAKNIIFLVSDGMSAAVPSMLDHYLQRLEGRKSYWRLLSEEPESRNGFMDCRVLNTMVTDSAAASSAWGSGVHVWSGAVNHLADGTELTTLYDLFKAQGARTGLVTTTTVTHATPAGFAASVPARGMEPEIAEQYVEKEIDVILGGGRRHFDGDARDDGRDLIAELRAKGYSICGTTAEMNAVASGRILGTFASGSLPYEIDRLNSERDRANIPSLAEMTRKAIGLLQGSADGFILQVEAARVDHAAHGNCAAGVHFDQYAFDDAVQVAWDFAREDGETLIVVTSDHGNANPGLDSGYGGYTREHGGVEGLARFTGSLSSAQSAINRATSPSAVQEVFESFTALQISDREAEMLYTMAQEETSPLDDFRMMSGMRALAGMIIGNHLRIGWMSGSHTSDNVMLTAWGPGAGLFNGTVQNKDVFGKLLSLRGIEYQNPALTLEEAIEVRARHNVPDVDAATEAHWV